MENKGKKVTACLTQIYGESTNKKFRLTDEKITIGRSYSAAIRLANPNVSRNHCILEYSNNEWKILDNKSQNGTYVSGRKLKPDEKRTLLCGDIIFLGPPSEMPEAFCYDDAFIDEYLDNYDDVQLASNTSPMKRPAECEILTQSKKSRSRANQDAMEVAVSSENTVPPLNSCSVKEVTNSGAIHSSKGLNHGFNRKANVPEKVKLTVNTPFIKSTKHAETNDRNRIIFDYNHKTAASPSSSPFKLSKSSDSEYQIHEISSTGDDQAEDSLSLLELDSIADPFPSVSSGESNKEGNSQASSLTSNETEALKSRLALLSEQVKNLEKSKSDLLRSYKVVCKKNKTLDEELAEKKKLELDFKNCELKAKDEVKNELLEKFEEDLICNICTELLIKPTVLDCSHTFCLFCIKEWKKKKNECPICRNRIQTMTPVLTLDNFIDKTLSTLTPEQREKRNQLIKERDNPPKKPVTPKSRSRSSRRRSRHRGGIMRTGGRAPQSMFAPRREGDIEIIGERRNNILPIPISPMTYQIPSLSSMFVRFPELLLSEGEGDSSISIYIS